MLTVQNINRAGIAPALIAAASGGNWFPNSGRTFVQVRNGSAAAITVTLNSIRACDQGFDHDEPISIPAGADRLIGPFPPGRWDNAEQHTTITYSAVTTVTVGVFELPQ